MPATYFKNIVIYVFLSFFALIQIAAYGQLKITGVNPVSGSLGSNVTISGMNFDPDPANNAVYFGSAKATITSTSPTSLTATVPAGQNAKPLSVSSNGLTASSSEIFSVTFPGGGPFHVGSFASKIDVSSPAYPAQVATADIDGDNKTDIVTANMSNKTFSVYRNLSAGTAIDLSNKTDFPVNNFCSAISVGDLNGDGKPDVVTGYSGFDTIYVFRNTSTPGNLSFATVLKYKVSFSPNEIAIADIDGNGKPEIIGAGSSNLNVLKNTSSAGNISFSPPVAVNGGRYVLAVMDLNGDGKPDLVSASGNNVLISTNTSTPGFISFAFPSTRPMGFEPVGLTTGDLNGDSKPEIVVASYGADYKISILQNTRTTSAMAFAAPIHIATTNEPWNIQVGDLTGDGKPDLVSSNNDFTSSISVYRNISTSVLSFEAKVDYNTGGKTRYSALVDLTNDGRLDIVSIIPTPGNMVVLRNKIGTEPPVITSFTPATAGPGSSITINGANLAGAIAVSFGGTAAASFTVVSDTKIIATIDSTASSGSVSVITPVGTAALAGFIFTTPPRVFSFSPLSGPVGQTVKIKGRNFGASASNLTVYFGAAKGSILSANDSTIYVSVPGGATYMPVSVSTNGYTVFTQKAFNITFRNGVILPTTFIKRYAPPLNYAGYPQNCAIADLDYDGKNDIILNSHNTSVGSSQFTDSFAVYRNTTTNGIVSFAARKAFKTSGNFTKNINFADFDGDGKPDVVAMNEYLYSVNGTLDIFRNISTPGNIQFTGQATYNFGVLTSNISIGDLDGDGKLDISASDGSNVVFVWRNTSSLGSISFEGPRLFEMVANTSNLSTFINDVDGDNKPDIVATSATHDSVSVFRNTSAIGNITFAQRIDINVNRPTSYVTMADMDNDGKQDLILGCGVYNNYSTYDSAILVVRNTSLPGIISFSPDIFSSKCIPTNIAINDLDGDGKPDISTVETNRKAIVVYRNTSIPGMLSFANKTDYVQNSNIEITSVAAGDIDGDVKPDLVYSDTYQFTFGVLVNQNPSDKSLCVNGNTSITSNISGSSYQWQVDTGTGYTNIANNSFYSGAFTSTLNITSVPGNWYGYKYRCIVNGNPGRVYTLKFESKWTGAADSSWENPANWSCNSLPDEFTDVIISHGSVFVNSNVRIRSLKLDPEVQLRVNPLYSMTILH